MDSLRRGSGAYLTDDSTLVVDAIALREEATVEQALAQMEHNSGHAAPGNHDSVRRFSVNVKSVFIFSCLCGREFQKEQKEAFHCPDCGRLLVLEWHFEDAGPECVAATGATVRSNSNRMPTVR